MGKIRIISFLTALCVTTPALAEERPEDAPPVDIDHGVKIPMRDRVQLHATVYRPHGQRERLPVIMLLTPYVGDHAHDTAMFFAQHGYVFVSVDSRGRNGSGGVFRSWSHEAHDGYDAVEWLAKQPWSNGKIGGWGGSYTGFTQWSTLKEAPPHLRTIVPTASVRPGIDFPQWGGVSYSYAAQWLTYVTGVASNGKVFEDNAFWYSKYAERYRENSPFRTLDRVVGNPSSIFQEYMQHPSYDAYWQAMAPNANQYSKIDIPILTITGYWDDDQTGAMSYYREHMQFGRPDVRARHYLVVGPWDHSGTRRPKKELEGVKFGDGAVVDMKKLHLAWYDWTLKGGKQPEFLKKRVAYYVTGEDTWKYADRVENVATDPRMFYLSSTNGIANDVFHSGALRATPPSGANSERADGYTYDPLDQRPGQAEIRRGIVEDVGLVDQTSALELYGAGLVYHSDPLPEDMELSGVPRASLSISMDVPDTDFELTLHEIKPDGSAVLLSSTHLRARYRESPSKEKPVPVGQIVRYYFDGFRFISRRLARGSRLRLVVSAINSIQWQKNYNSGGVVADETAKSARTAHVFLHHDAAHPSAIELPFVRPTAPSK